MKIFGLDVIGTKTKPEYLSVDFGDSAIKIARATYKGGRVSVTMADREPIGGDAPYLEAAEEALQKLVERNGISSGQSVAMALPTSAVIVRPLELPSMPEERLARVIEYEAESHIPFPLEEVVLDYHVVEETEESIETILVAIKRDKLTSHIDVVEAAGLSPGIIDVATFSLYNIYRYLEGNHDGETSALIDLGHESTDIAIFDGETLRFARSTSIGGQDLTKAIERRLDVSSEEARKLKHEIGHVPLEKPEESGTGMDALQELAAAREKERAEEAGEAPSPPSIEGASEGLSLELGPLDDDATETDELEAGESSPALDGPAPPEVPEEESESPEDEDQELQLEPPSPPGGEPEEAGLSLGEPYDPEKESKEEPDLVIDDPEDVDFEQESSPKPPSPPQDRTGSEETPAGTPEEEPEESGLDLGEPFEPEKEPSEDIDREEQPPPEPDTQMTDDTGSGPPGPPPSPSSDDGEEEDSEGSEENDDDGPRLNLGAAATPDNPESGSEEDERAKQVGMAIRTEVDSIINEIRHTFDFFQTQLGGETIDRVVLTGGGAHLNNLNAVVEEELGLTVETFEPMDRVDGISSKQIMSQLVCLGLQLRQVPEDCGVEIDLIPDYILYRRRKEKQKQDLMAIGTQAVLLLLLLGGIFYGNYHQRGALLAQSEELLDTYRPIVDDVREMEQRNEALETRRQAIDELESQRAQVLHLLETLNQVPGNIRPQTQIDSISYDFREDRQSEIDLQGITGSFDDVATFDDWFVDQWFVIERTSESQSRTSITVDGEARSAVQFSLSYRVSFLEED